MDITITMLNGESRSLLVNPETTVGSLKNKILEMLQVPCERQRLTYDNGQKTSLDDVSRSLGSYGLGPGAVVWVLVTDPTPVQVFLKNEKAQTHTYDIIPGEKVQSFKLKVKNREGVPVDQQRLIHEGKQMDDGDRTLESYHVKEHSTIYLTGRLRGG